MTKNKYYAQKGTAILLIFVGLFPLALAWYLQNVWNMAPCGLCLLERWPYRVLVITGIFSFFTSSRYFTWVLGIGLLVLLVSVGLSFLHIGVEQGWWRSPLPECNAVAVHHDNLVDRFAALPDHPSKPCDLPTYIFAWFPVSLTMLNGFYSFICFCLLGLKIYSNIHNRRIYF